MSRIEETNKTAGDFLRNLLHVDESKIKVIRTERESGAWEAEVEVYEESSFIKSIGLPTRVQDRNVYVVRLDDNLEILSYGRKEPQPTE